MTDVVTEWTLAGSAVDSTGVPHEVKAFFIRTYAHEFELDVFVETGTCHGHMIEAVVDDFIEVHSVEMYEPNYQIALDKFHADPRVNLYCGDSGEVLEAISKVLDKEETPALYFLDAHYSGGGTARGAVDTPIVNELASLSKSNQPNVIVIDDARLFAGEAYHADDFKDYPSFAWICDFVESRFVFPSEVERVADEFIVFPAS